MVKIENTEPVKTQDILPLAKDGKQLEESY